MRHEDSVIGNAYAMRYALGFARLFVVTLALGTTWACQPQSLPAAARTVDREPRVHRVETDAVRTDTLRLRNSYSGSLSYRRSVRVFTQEEGRIAQLRHYEGDAVGDGELVLRLDDRLLRAELDKAEATARQARANLNRVRELRERKLVSEEDFLSAQTLLDVAAAETRVLQTRLSYTRVKASFAGVVVERLAEPGDVVNEHQHVMTIADPDSLVINISASERVIPNLSVGKSVQVYIDALGDRAYPGSVVRVHPQLDTRTRLGTVEIQFRPVPPGAMAGQFARVSFSIDALNRNVVPFSAVRRDRQGEFVYRLDPDNKARRVAVRSGRRLADRIEIVDGVESGDTVITRGFLGLRDGMTVTPVDTGDATDPVAGTR